MLIKGFFLWYFSEHTGCCTFLMRAVCLQCWTSQIQWTDLQRASDASSTTLRSLTTRWSLLCLTTWSLVCMFFLERFTCSGMHDWSRWWFLCVSARLLGWTPSHLLSQNNMFHIHPYLGFHLTNNIRIFGLKSPTRQLLDYL